MAARLPGAVSYAGLLEELSPEVSKRWVQRHAALSTPRAFSPSVYKGLLSVLLRATSRAEASETLKVLQSTLASPLENQSWPLERLGFAPTEGATFLAVLADLLESGLKQDPLLVDGVALRFYSRGGPGSSDKNEYGAEAGTDARNRNRVRPCGLGGVRAGNLGDALQFFATVLGRMEGSLLEDASRDYRAKMRRTFFLALPSAVGGLSAGALGDVLAAYCAVINLESGVERREYVVGMRSMFNALARRDDGRALRCIATALAESLPKDVMTATLECLETFVDVEEKKMMKVGKMSADLFLYKIVKSVLQSDTGGGTRHGAPTLLLVLSRAWMAVGESNEFILEGCKGQPKAIRDEEMAEATCTVNCALNVLEKRQADTLAADDAAAKNAITATLYRILHASGSSP